MKNFQLNKIPNQSFFKSSDFWQIILLFLIALTIWQIYYPGLMSPDSIDQYGQALEGNFNDWHPPLMSVVLWLIMKLGGGIGTLTFLQCLSALFGLRSAVSLSIQFFSNQGVSKQKTGLIATIATIFFLIPFLTPFMFISVIFWKDAWLAIILLWITSYLLWVFLNFENLNKRNFIIHCLLLSFASSIIVVVRHNAIVITPVICIALAALSKIKFGNRGLIIAVLPLLLAVILNPLMNSVFNINDVKAGNLVVARDLTMMLRLYPELIPEYPHTMRHENNRRDTPKALIIELGNENKELQDEYAKTLTTHPVKFLSAKLYLFWQMLSPDHWWKQKLPYDIIVNPYGLKINEEYGGIRYKLNALSLNTGHQWYFIWISGLHVVWLVLNVLCVFYFSIKVFKKRDRKSIFTLLLYLLPLSYYFSYVLAATTPDYRFMYPATLLMQLLVVSLLLSRVFEFFQKPNNNSI